MIIRDIQGCFHLLKDWSPDLTPSKKCLPNPAMYIQLFKSCSVWFYKDTSERKIEEKRKRKVVKLGVCTVGSARFMIKTPLELIGLTSKPIRTRTHKSELAPSLGFSLLAGLFLGFPLECESNRMRVKDTTAGRWVWQKGNTGGQALIDQLTWSVFWTEDCDLAEPDIYFMPLVSLNCPLL